MRSRDPGASEGEGEVPDPTLLIDLASKRMPFGRYQGRLLIDLPGPYVAWFQDRGLPSGRLGQLLGVLYEVKANGLEHLVRPLRDHPNPKPTPAPRSPRNPKSSPHTS